MAVTVDDGASRHVVVELLADVAARADGPFAEGFARREVEIEDVAGLVVGRGVLGVEVEKSVQGEVPAVLGQR